MFLVCTQPKKTYKKTTWHYFGYCVVLECRCYTFKGLILPRMVLGSVKYLLFEGYLLGKATLWVTDTLELTCLHSGFASCWQVVQMGYTSK